MDIAGHNIQKENKDVYNLWTWPAEYYGLSWFMDTTTKLPFKPWKWISMYNTGFGGGQESNTVKFTSNSMTKTANSGFAAAALFLGIEQPGEYVLSFDADGDSYFQLIRYIKHADGGVQYVEADLLKNTYKGHTKIQFTVEAGCVLMAQFGRDIRQDVMYTNFKIREGIL